MTDDEAPAGATIYQVQQIGTRGSLRELPRLTRLCLRILAAADRRGLLTLIAFTLVSGVLLTVQALAARTVIDRTLAAYAARSGLGPVLPAVVLLLLAGLAGGAIQAYAQGREQLLGERTAVHVQGVILDAATGARLEDFDRPQFHDRLQRAQAAIHRPLGLARGLLTAIGAVVTLVATVVTLLALEPVLAAAVPIAAIPVVVAMLRHADAYYAFAFSMTPAERERGYLVHVLSDRDSAKEVRAFGTAPWLRGRYEALTGERLRGLRRVLATQLRAQVVASAATSVLVAALLLGLLQLSLTGRLGLADLTVAAGLVTVAGGRVGGVGWAVGELWEAALFVRDVTDLTDIVAARTPSTATTSGTGSASRTGGPAAVTALETVDVDAVHFTYPAGDREALRGVDLQIGAGEIVALVGENGSGKTTLAKLIGGFYAPSGGRVRWNGLDCATLDEAGTAALREQVTVLFQDFVHYLLSARLNIALGHPDALDDTAAVEAAARAAGANSVVSGLPQGYETLLAPAFFGGTDLSGGQWQRIALARALVRRASLVVLDEPTAALDPRAEHELFARIRALFAGRAVLLVSHRFSTVREADRIYVLHEGEVVEQGTHDELVARGGRYAELYELQASSFR